MAALIISQVLFETDRIVLWPGPKQKPGPNLDDDKTITKGGNRRPRAMTTEKTFSPE